MTPEERDLIGGLFQKLRQSGGGALDREAADFIARCIGEQPAAPYYLTQAVLVQDHALKGAQARIAQLEQALEQARTAQPGAAAGTGTSFLGGLMGEAATPAAAGPWGRHATPLPPAAAAPARPAPAAPPPAYAPQPAYAQPQASAVPSSFGRGGGFMQSALSTAAGVAGGALLFQGIESLLGYHNGPFSGGYGRGFGGQPGMVENNTTINNYGDASAAGANAADPYAASNPDPGDQGADTTDASDQSYDDGSSDSSDTSDDGGFDDSGDGGSDDF